MSGTFTSLVTAMESLAGRGTTHSVYCAQCGTFTNHDSPGSTRLFRDLIEKFAPGEASTKIRSEMYALRSRIVHGSDLL